MRIAAISDIHGNLPALNAVLADIERQGVDMIVNLGDILSGPLQPAETADLLMARGLPTITGNHERQLLALHARGEAFSPVDSDGYAASQLAGRYWDWLRGLPAQHRLAPDVLMVHGTPASDLHYFLETATPGFGEHGGNGVRPASLEEVRERLGAVQASLVLCGHTHTPRAMQCGNTLVVNPGSVGVQAYEWNQPQPHRVEIGSPHARYAIVERTGAGSWNVQLRALAYDFEPQARLAQERGRPDWASALATGRMPRAPGSRS